MTMLSERMTLDPSIALPEDGVRPRDRSATIERRPFSLAKGRRRRPILHPAGESGMRVRALPEHNRKSGAGQSTSGSRLARDRARQGRWTVLIAAAASGSTHDGLAQRVGCSRQRVSEVFDPEHGTPYGEPPEMAREHRAVDGPPGVTAPLPSVLLAGNLAVISVQPARIGCGASVDALKPRDGVRRCLSGFRAMRVLHRRTPRVASAQDVAVALVDANPQALAPHMHQHPVGTAPDKPIVCGLPRSRIAAREIRTNMVRVVAPGERGSAAQHRLTRPGILLCESTLPAMGAVPAREIDPADCLPEHRRPVHTRFIARSKRRPCNRERHAASHCRRRNEA